MGPAVAAGLMAGLILSAVALRSALHIWAGQGDGRDTQRSGTRQVTGFAAAPTITDRDGRILAMSVPVYDLSLSPQSMWRAHTPTLMTKAILAILTDRSVGELSERDVRSFLGQLLPPDDQSPTGEACVLSVNNPRLLRFSGSQRPALSSWIERGALQDEPARGVLRGLRLVELPDDACSLQWTPEVLLSRSLREEHLGAGTSARSWVNHLLDDLAVLVGSGVMDAHLRVRAGDEWSSLAASQVRARARDALWGEWLDCQYRVACKSIDVPHALALSAMLEDQAVSRWQMQLEMHARRTYALRPPGFEPSPFVSLAAQGEHDPIAVMGHWGRLDRSAAQGLAERMLEWQPEVVNWQSLSDPRKALQDQLIHESRPMAGLELLARDYLDQEPWVQGRASTLRAVPRVLPRDRRHLWLAQGLKIPSDLLAAQAGSSQALVETTLAADLQMYLHQELVETLEKQRAVLAMGIVLDPATGEVLAVDAAHAYRVSGFAPLQYLFTPGSTTKALIMATALDQGLVQPDDLFKTFAAQGGIRLGSRHISEARGAPTEPEVSARVALSRSVNAVMVQIGARVPAPVLRASLHRLGLGQRPGVGLGPESRGYLPPLDAKGSWSPHFTHASVSMGHEMSVSMWQMASALATVVRGGEQLPLRLVRAIRQGPQGEGIGFVAPEGERVLGEKACAQVRSMMEMGAREGTGRTVTQDHRADFDLLLSKTGTAERVSTEGCPHDEHRALARAAAEGRSLTPAERARLRGSRNSGHRNCYTASICLVGRAKGSERELMTFIVVEDASARSAFSHFGSRVAGPPAMRVLRVALGLSPETIGAQAAGVGVRSGGVEVRSDPSEYPALYAASDQAWKGALR
jgi:cell division protein FtsI/penicillin-binding protein 2